MIDIYVPFIFMWNEATKVVGHYCIGERAYKTDGEAAEEAEKMAYRANLLEGRLLDGRPQDPAYKPSVQLVIMSKSK